MEAASSASSVPKYAPPPARLADGYFMVATDFMWAVFMGGFRQEEKLRRFGATLEGRELEIFRDRIVADEPITLQELGDKFGVSRERVRQLEARLVGKLRAHLRDELDEETPRIMKVEDRTWDVDARATIEELAKGIGVHLEEPAETVGVVVLGKLGIQRARLGSFRGPV